MRPSDFPVPSAMRSGSPRARPTSGAGASSLSAARGLQTRRRVGALVSRGSVHVPGALPQEDQGSPRLPVRPCRACHGPRPRRARRLLARISATALLPSAREKASAPGMLFRGCVHTARTLAYLRINRRVAATTARLATGPSGSTLAGREFHPLDGSLSFTCSSHAHAPPSQALPGRNSPEALDAERTYR
jgi:hypothetical protein